jgi:hypothetical protein
MTVKASASWLFRGYRGASAPAAYASRMVLPPSMQGLLPAGWPAFAGRELNPLDRDEGFQITSSSSPLDFSWRNIGKPSQIASFCALGDHFRSAPESRQAQRRRVVEARLKPLIRKTQPYSKRIAASGSSRRCRRRLRTGRSPPRARCAIRCTKARGKTYELDHREKM